MTGLAVLHRGTTTPDGVLVQEAAAGSGVSYGALYDRYAEQVFNYTLRLTGSQEDAKDATQEAFVNVLRRLQDDDRPVLEFSSYLFAAARHESYALMRQRARTHPTDSPPVERGRIADVETDPERAALLRDSQEAVRAANAQLPPRHREVLALREVAGRSYAEIGKTIGISENAAAQLIFRARSKLRGALTAGAVASVVATSEECATAQALLSMVQDGEAVAEVDRIWLEEHLDECDSCKTSNRLLLEIGASYRCWAPVALLAGMRSDTLASAGKVVGADWSSVPTPGQASAGSSAGGVAGVAAVAAVVIAAAGIGALTFLRDDEGAPGDRGAEKPAASAPAAAEKGAATSKEEAAVASTPFGAARAHRPGGAPVPAALPEPKPNKSEPRAAPETDSAPPKSGGPNSPPRPRDRPGRPSEGTPRSDNPPPGNPAPPDTRGGPPATAPGPSDPTPAQPTPRPHAPSGDPEPPPPAARECSWPGGGNGPGGGCPPGHGGTPPGHGGTPPGQKP
jgi:RNA polymerase sigma factor (sigma-70 family)